MKNFMPKLGLQEYLEKGLIAKILMILCLLFIVFGAVFVIFRLFVTFHPALPDAHWSDILIESIIFLAGFFSLLLIRKNKTHGASRLILTGLLVIITMQAYFIGDPINDIAGAMGLLLFAFLSILLLDGRDRWIAVLLVVGIFVGLNILSASGNLSPSIYLDPSSKTLFIFFVWLSVGIILALVLMASMSAMRREPQLLQQTIEASGAPGSSPLPYISTHDRSPDSTTVCFLKQSSTVWKKAASTPSVLSWRISTTFRELTRDTAFMLAMKWSLMSRGCSPTRSATRISSLATAAMSLLCSCQALARMSCRSF